VQRELVITLSYQVGNILCLSGAVLEMVCLISGASEVASVERVVVKNEKDLTETRVSFRIMQAGRWVHSE